MNIVPVIYNNSFSYLQNTPKFGKYYTTDKSCDCFVKSKSVAKAEAYGYLSEIKNGTACLNKMTPKTVSIISKDKNSNLPEIPLRDKHLRDMLWNNKEMIGVLLNTPNNDGEIPLNYLIADNISSICMAFKQDTSVLKPFFNATDKDGNSLYLPKNLSCVTALCRFHILFDCYAHSDSDFLKEMLLKGDFLIPFKCAININYLKYSPQLSQAITRFDALAKDDIDFAVKFFAAKDETGEPVFPYLPNDIILKVINDFSASDEFLTKLSLIKCPDNSVLFEKLSYTARLTVINHLLNINPNICADFIMSKNSSGESIICPNSMSQVQKNKFAKIINTILMAQDLDRFKAQKLKNFAILHKEGKKI